ncbi:hypothetical protein B0T22DRAFT_241113 [Podospora appendiculata]|uniref:Uncharacterized protein n=1 Tax=Podospora appendiculata TaxID=314037 RepID=A0AAE0X6Z9_9PEZI|nr:hypothetical protein B0T22DRAFT_241113 [Podospora appendiculata]
MTPITVAWDLIEFIVICAQRGKGIAPEIHVWVDGIICLGTACATLLLWTDIMLGGIGILGSLYVDRKEHLPKEIGVAAMLLILLILHSFQFFLYICRNREKREKKTTPRIMNLPTGEVVVVTNRPVDLGLKVQQQPADVPRRLQRTAPNPNVKLMLSPNSRPPPPRIHAITPSAPAAATSPTSAVLPAAQPIAQGDEFDEPFRQGVPPRKPVAGAKVGTHYAAPWLAPDHQPDEAERARAARGETQAQWVSLHGMHLKGQGEGKADGPVGRQSLTIQDGPRMAPPRRSG